MKYPLFSSSFITLVGESGFRLFPQDSESFELRREHVLYLIENTRNGWLFDHFEKDKRQEPTQTLKSTGELENLLRKRIEADDSLRKMTAEEVY